MADLLWSQDYFSQGELSPLMYSRVTTNAYYQGLKRAKNVLSLPQGAAGKRFGTKFVYQLAQTNYKQIYFKSFQYLNECCYLIVFYNNAVDIYLEGYLVQTVTNTGIMANEIQLIDHTILENRFRITTGLYPPKDLKRNPQAPVLITGFTATTLTHLVLFATNLILPAQFTFGVPAVVGQVLPITTPQIHSNKTYFIKTITANAFKVYTTAQEAAADIGAYTISSQGLNATVVVLDYWTLENVVFKQYPVFDFDGGYNGFTFTPTALTGYGINIICSGLFFKGAFTGGAFIGNNGICRIVQVVGQTIIKVDIIQPFSSLDPIPGTQCLIAEPAWSVIRGFPRKCSSFQNRAFFANTELLTNGLWGSVINDFDDFDGLENSNPDDAITWFPTSDSVNYILFIVPYRSLTIHTNSGVYSTPLGSETALTPANFALSLQDSTPADKVQPQAIDNQIIVLSGNDAHSLLWDGLNNAYTSNIVSIANEQLIRTPTDEAAYVDKVRAGSRYMLIVNEEGTLAIYQTLLVEKVTGFTLAVLEQPVGNAYFRWVTSNFDGRAWFVTEREIDVAGTLTSTLFIEELDFDAYVDCAGYYPAIPSDPPTSTIAGQTRFNGQTIQMQGDGYGFEDTVEGGNVEFIAHGEPQIVTDAQYGFPIDVEIKPLPLSMPTASSPKSSNLLDTKHLRFVTFLFSDTIGGTITDQNNIVPIAMGDISENQPGDPPTPTTGSFQMALFGGWNDFKYNSFTINHREPFNFKLTGIFYVVDS